MFKKRFCIVCCLVVAAFWMGTAYGTIRVADNTLNAPTGDNVFSSLQDAIDEAVAGDIIQVIPSPTSYGDVTINKRLTVYGVGLNPDKDLPLTSTVGTITLGRHTIYQTDASGTIVSGLVASGVSFSGGSGVTLSNIIIERCRFAGSYIRISSGSVDNLRIRNCIIAIPFNPYQGRATIGLAGATSVVITNNVFYSVDKGIEVDNNTFISNNIFLASANSNRPVFYYIRDCTVANNIFYGAMPTASSSSKRNIFNNNLTFGTNANDLPPDPLPPDPDANTGADNLVGANPSFEDFPLEGSDTFDFSYDFRLKAGSQAIGAGTDGTDIGIFGGSNPLDSLPHVVPSLPLIQKLNASSVVRQGGDLNVTVKAKSN